ncbi:hypothetical protein [Haloferula sp.]|uniref:hypothetical protein n=1 Tax=Haloferula sp. TaxID=2497595 RepID=UPI00329F734D
MSAAMMSVCVAKTVDVGGRTLEIPAPEGFVELTEDMSALYAATKKIVDSDNDTLAYYIPSEMADAAKAGEFVPAVKYFVLKAQGNTKFVTMGNSEFASLAAGVKSANQMVTDELKMVLGDSFDPAAVVELKGIAVLPPHRETETTLANSMLIRQTALGGKGEGQVMSATKTYANIGGKVMLLAAYGAEQDSEWTRTAVGAWTDAVLAGNPNPPVGDSSGGSLKEEADGVGFKSAVIGAIVGALVVFVFSSLKSRRKA